MIPITLRLFTHRGANCIAIEFAYNFAVKEYVKKFQGVLWSQSQRTFYVFFTEATLNLLSEYLIQGGYRVIDIKNQDVSVLNRVGKEKVILKMMNEKQIKIHSQFIEYLEGKRYSKSTIASYAGFILNFLRYTGDKDSNLLDEEDVRLYSQWAVNTFDYSISTHRQLVSAFKQFAFFYPACAINVDQLSRPKRDQKLPVVLSKVEVMGLIQNTKNLKHRTAIALLYGSGLRVGELLALTLDCFDFNRKMLHIKNAKGRKDRYATIPESIYPMLKNYYATYKPKNYFIENPKGGKYAAGSIRSFIKQSAKRAGITKTVTPHTLRHSYATHLLEAGTGIRYIQELLGHSKPETTMIYTHIAEKDLQVIKSPLDLVVSEITNTVNNHKKVSISGTDFRI